MSESFGPHVADLAESYALGALSPAESAQVLEHARECPECGDRVRAAEEAVTAMIEASDLREPPAVLRRWIAGSTASSPASLPRVWSGLAAALLLLWIVPAGWFYLRDRRAAAALGEQSAAIHALVGSHFLHAEFVAGAPGAPAAKLIYARNGEWIYVVVDAPADDLQIGTASGNTIRILGRPTDVNGSSEFYARTRERMNGVLILRGGRVIARASMAETAR